MRRLERRSWSRPSARAGPGASASSTTSASADQSRARTSRPRGVSRSSDDAALARVVVPPPQRGLAPGRRTSSSERARGDERGCPPRRLDAGRTSAPGRPAACRRTRCSSLASSTTRSPARRRSRPQTSQTPRLAARSISSAARPSSSPKTCRCARRGTARRARSTSRSRERCTGSPSTRTSPIAACSTVGHSPQAAVFGSSSMRSAGRATAAAGTPACRQRAAPPRTRRAARPRRRAGRRARPAPSSRPGEVARSARRRAHGRSTTSRERRPVGVVAAGDRDPRVVAARRVDAVRRHRRPRRCGCCRRPVAPQRPAVDGPVEQRRPVQRGAGLGAGHVDPLALAGAAAVESGSRIADRHVVAARVVHVRVAPAGRRLVGQARGERQAATCACTIGPHVLNGAYGPVAPNPQFET